ncbi:MAG: two-component system, NtrC family, sensor histidine kinase AtoS [Candidatus Poribacteria bacterium]|nr:two-component system, NtrC family, sensor histidine kinase AtoS [Candidatus Poribacteria bacterium]
MMLNQSLSLKIILFVIVILAIFAYVNFKAEEKQMMLNSRQTAKLLSSVIDSGLNEAMIEGKTYKVQKMIESYRAIENIDKIRIFAPESGSILVDVDKKNIGTVIERKYIDLLNDIGYGERNYKNSIFIKDDKKILSVVKPILNGPKCYQCHNPKKQVLGALDIDILVMDTFANIAETRFRVIQFALLAIIGTSLAMTFLFIVLVNRPTRKLLETMSKIESGDLNAKVRVANISEFGQLAKSFNSMAMKIRKDIERLEVLHETAKDLRSTNDLSKIENITVQGIIQALKFDRVALLLISEENGSEQILEGRMGVGIAKNVIQQVRIPLNREYGILLDTILDAKTYNVKRGISDAYLLPEKDVKCWETHQCEKIECPAYHSDDLACWFKSETHCRNNIQISFADKTEVCCECSVIKEAYGKKASLVLMMFGSEAFVTVPLMAQDKAIGLIMVDNLYSKRTITDEDIKGLGIFASQAGMAIENAKLYNKLENKIEIANEELRQKIASLMEMKNFNDSILQNMSNGLITVDLEGKIIYFNSSAETILGYKAQEVKGNLIVDMFSILASLAYQTLHENKNFVFHEIDVITKTGKNIPVEVSTLSLKNDVDEATCVVLILTNLTERKEMEKQIRRADKLATLGQLAAGIAHEIRNPLAGISGAVQILADDVIETDSRKEIFDEILERIKSLNDAINDFLRFTRPAPLQLSPTNVNEIIQSILFLINRQAETQGITIIEEYDDNLPLIMADSEQLQQVILNIAINALQAIHVSSSNGRIEAKIRFKTYQNVETSQIAIEISDTGIGIPPEKLDQIFNPYFTTKSEGTGLGLSIAQRIIEEHHGIISVISEIGKGTTFRVILKNG